MGNSRENRVTGEVKVPRAMSLWTIVERICFIICVTLSLVPTIIRHIFHIELNPVFLPSFILPVIICVGLILIKLFDKIKQKLEKINFKILKNFSKRCLGKISPKTRLLLILLFLNIISLYFHYRFFSDNFQNIIQNNIANDVISKRMILIGLSWFYTLFYNIFLFFPLLISIYFRKFKHPKRYLYAFFDAVLHENVVAVILGLLLNIMLSVSPLYLIYKGHDPDMFQEVALSQAWIGSLIIWLSPFLASLFQLETKFEANFDRKLRSFILEMKDHIVVIGYGNLGKKICSDLIEEDIISSGNNTTEILYPDLEVRKICTSLLVVDISDQWFDRIHIDPILEEIGVARIEGKKKDILIPAIIGDIKSKAIREGSNLINSNLFILASADYAATFTMSRFANSVDANSIIAVRDSAQKDYFSPKMTAHDTFFIYPTFQAGISLGRIASLCYFKLAEKIPEEDSPRIAIAGEGKQIHYLIETFWIEMQAAGIAKHWAELEPFKLPITILTEDRDLVRCHNVSEPPKRGKYTKIKGIITRLARIDKINAWMLIDLVFDAPSKLKTIEKIINKEKPEVIVITSKTIEDVSKILHEWIMAIERYNSKIYKEGFYKPMIIVGVLGDEYMEIQDILLYYSKLEAMYGNLKPGPGTQFPTYLDSTVRVYDDSAEQISGLAYAFIRTKSKGKTEYKDPFVLYCCLKDVSGSLAYILGKLACIEFGYHEFKGVKRLSSEKEVISLRFCRYQNCPDEHRFSFLANAELETKTDVDDEDRVSHCLFQGNIKNKEGKKNITYIKENLGVIGYGLLENKDIAFAKQFLGEICSRCNQRIICPLSSYLRKAKNLVENRENYEVLEELGRIKKENVGLGRIKRDIVGQEISRFLVNPGFKRSGVHIKPKKSIPRAVIMMCCKSEIPGSLAAAVNSLLFKEIDVEKSKKVSGKSADRVTAVTYIKSSGCYDPKSSCFEFYGNFVDREPEKICDLKKKGVIDLVLINAVTEKQEWWNYANDLFNVLNANSGTDKKSKCGSDKKSRYELCFDRKKNPSESGDYPDNIAIIRDGNCSKLTFDCSKKDCIIHYKLKLIEKNGTQLNQ